MKTVQKKAVPNDPFADTLLVRSLSSTKTNTNNNIRIKKHVEVQKEKCYIPQKFRNYERPDPGPSLEKTGLKCFIDETKRDEPRKIHVSRQLKKSPLGSGIKMISMNMPRFGTGQAVIKSNFLKEPCEKKSKHSDVTFAERAQNDAYEPGDLLQEAQEEIDISQDQLQKLHSILKNKNPARFQPKWDVECDKRVKKGNSKERVITTLSNLNKKLSDMQEKYFDKKTTPYKSIKDIPSRSKVQGEIERTTSNTAAYKHDDTRISRSILKKKTRFLPQELSKSNFPTEMFEKYIPPSEKNIFKSTNPDKSEFLRNLSVFEKFHPPSDRSIDTTTTGVGQADYHENQDFSGGPDYELDSLFNSSRTRQNIASEIGVTESNSDAELPIEAQNRIIERYHLSRISRLRDKFSGKKEDGSINTDKGQTYVNSIPEILLRDQKCDQIQSRESENEIKMLKESRRILDESLSDLSIAMEDGMMGMDDFHQTNVERIQKMLLAHEDKKGILKKGPETSTREQTVKQELNKSKGQTKLLDTDLMRSQSSTAQYYDCQSPLDSPSTSNKKIFYDNFGRHSNISDKKNQTLSTEMNSAPNLNFKAKSALNDDISGRMYFDGTPVQNSVLKSNYLTKMFSIPQNEDRAQKPFLSTNKSDQYFTGALEVKDKGTKSVKFSKDTYTALTKALSNSFYKLPPQT